MDARDKEYVARGTILAIGLLVAFVVVGLAAGLAVRVFLIVAGLGGYP